VFGAQAGTCGAALAYAVDDEDHADEDENNNG